MNKAALWRPLDKENISNPYRMYEQLRSTQPVYRSQTNEYIITRYRDVKQILKSPSFESGNRFTWLKRGIDYFDNREQDLRAIYQAMNSFILMLNDEHHMRIRSFIARTWSNREVDTIIRSNVEMLLREIKGKDFDFVGSYAQPLPVHTISAILGVPTTDVQHLIALGTAITKTLDLYVTLKDLVMINKAAKEFIEYFQEQIKIKSDHPDEGLLSKLIQRNKSENAGLTEQELVSIAIFLFTAGEETSAGLISNAMLALLRHPHQLALLRRSPDLIVPTIDEVLRYDSTVQLLGRISKKPVTLHNKVIPSGASITLVVGSANRDEEVFENADRFIISRQPNRHLSFGTGVHYCLGDWLGKRQSQLAIQMFLDRFPEITLPDQELAWYKNIAIRRLNALQICVSP